MATNTPGQLGVKRITGYTKQKENQICHVKYVEETAERAILVQRHLEPCQDT